MDEIKYKVILLGFDGVLLKNVVERVNQQRPVEVIYFTDLKDFLEACIEEQPDLVGVSVSYPHGRVAKFPKIFRMTLNLPILTFGENQEVKTRKALSASTGDLKIQGVITAHNLWMKIVNFQKMQEEEEEKARGKEGEVDGAGNSVFLKNKKQPNTDNKSSILNNLFSALNDTNKPKESSNFNHIKSDQKQDSKTNTGSESSSSKPKMDSRDSDLKTNTSIESSISNSEQKGPSFSHIAGGEQAKKTKPSASASKINKKVSELDELLDNEITRNSSEGSNASQMAGGKKSGKGFANEKSQKSPTMADGGSSSGNSSQNGDSFGKVQLKDEKAVKEETDRKSKEKTLRDQTKKMNVLEVASETALEKTFKAPRAQEIRRFSSTQVVVYTVDMGAVKGYLLMTNDSDNAFFEQSSEFKKTLIESLKSQGAQGDFSEPYLINIEVPNYIASIAEFAEFNVNHQTPEGVCFNAAFVQREVVLPHLSDSDKPAMYFVDIKVIPPQTPVNFDAFIYLPRNNRFVRYLKEGRSLSLKQAKRHSEEDDGQNKLYIPKDQRHEFESFFIKNTLNWEFELHKSSDAA